MNRCKVIELSWKIPLAIFLVGCIFSFAGRDIAPRFSVWWSLLIFAGIGLVFLCAVILASIFQSRVNQYVLKKGGTDAQWLWFAGDKNPPGLQNLLDEKDEDPSQPSRNEPGGRRS